MRKNRWRLTHYKNKLYRSGAIAGAEILTFSSDQLFTQVDSSGKWNVGSMFTRAYYNGIEFTNRSNAASSSPWSDAILVFIGKVNETQIQYKEQDHYNLYCTLRDEVEIN